MKKTFRDYARSFATGLALGVASFLPACSTHNDTIVEPEKARDTYVDARSVDLDREELPRYPDSVPDEFGYTQAEYRKVEFRLGIGEGQGVGDNNYKLSDGRVICVERRGLSWERRIFIDVLDLQSREVYGWFILDYAKGGIIVDRSSDERTVGGRLKGRQIFEIETPEEAKEQTVLYREMLRAFDKDFPSEK